MSCLSFLGFIVKSDISVDVGNVSEANSKTKIVSHFNTKPLV